MVDSNEASRHADRIKVLETVGNVEVHQLEVGDYLVNGKDRKILIERKSYADFRQSLLDGRLFAQLQALSASKEQGFEPYILLEASSMSEMAWITTQAGKKRYVRRPTEWVQFFADNPSWMKTFFVLLVDIGKFGVSIIVTEGPEETTKKIVGLAAEVGHAKRTAYPWRDGFKKEWGNDKKKQYVLDAFGPSVRKTLLEQYKTIDVIVDALEKNGAEPFSRLKVGKKAMGLKKAQEIYDVLTQ